MKISLVYRWTIAALLVAILLAAAPVSAETRKKSTASDRRAKKRDVVKELCGISWHTNYAGACNAAQPQSSDDIGKPVMHLRVLGALDGLM
jgi:hypothetical protein